MEKYNYYFTYTWPNPPRTTMKSEWKAACRFLRTCRRHIHEKLEAVNIHKKVMDAMVYGKNWVVIE